MATQQKQLARLRRYNLSVRENDPKLAEEVRDLGYEVRAAEEALSPQAADEMLGLESIAMRTQRPSASDPRQRHPASLHRRS